MVKTETYRHIIDDYRFSYHGGAELLEIEKWENSKSWCKGKWVRIYFSHSTPVEKAVEFYLKCRKENGY